MKKLRVNRETVRNLGMKSLALVHGGGWTASVSDGATGCKSEATGCYSWQCTLAACPISPECVPF